MHLDPTLGFYYNPRVMYALLRYMWIKELRCNLYNRRRREAVGSWTRLAINPRSGYGLVRALLVCLTGSVLYLVERLTTESACHKSPFLDRSPLPLK